MMKNIVGPIIMLLLLAMVICLVFCSVRIEEMKQGQQEQEAATINIITQADIQYAVIKHGDADAIFLEIETISVTGTDYSIIATGNMHITVPCTSCMLFSDYETAIIVFNMATHFLKK